MFSKRKLGKTFSRMHDKLGTAGLFVAIAALVAALAGTALAAGGLTKQQEKQVTKIAKKYAGKPGAQGPQGPQGPAGPAGAKGDPGAQGAPGVGVKVTSLASGDPECTAELGGAIVEKEGSGQPVPVCNGEDVEKGAKGEKGEPWTPNSQLPAGATLTGTWAFAGEGENQVIAWAPLSFTIPLKGELGATGCGTAPKPATCQVHYQTEADFSKYCKGGNGGPEPLPGHLCVFENENAEAVVNANFLGIHKVGGEELGLEGASFVGAVLAYELTGANARGNGSYAVTAPNPKVTGVSPALGPAAGGTSVTITGTNLAPLVGAEAVKFGGVNAPGCTVNSAATEVTCTTPPHAAGAVDVVVTVTGYESPVSATTKFTYQ